MMGRALGAARPTRPLDGEPFATFIKSKSGAGEIGLPDPQEAIRNLKIALVASISVDVVVKKDGPQVRFVFDQGKLLKMTPHPDTMEGGSSGAFHSWLSLVTGPNFVSSTPGYSLVRANDIIGELTNAQDQFGRRSSTRGELRSVRALNGLLRISRTREYAGMEAGIMLSNRRRNNRQSTAEFAGGSNQDYTPSRRFEGFWDEWWSSTKLDLGVWSRRIMFAAIRGALKEVRVCFISYAT